MITLYDDWLLRREKFAAALNNQFAAIQLRIIDFLLARYADDPKVREPAQFPFDGSTNLNSRAILVHGRLRARDPAEAHSRAKTLLNHIAEINPQESIGAPGSLIPAKRWQFTLCSLHRPDLGNAYKLFFFDAWLSQYFALCWAELKQTDMLAESTISYLVNLALSPEKTSQTTALKALYILENCNNDSVIAIWWNRGLCASHPRELVERIVAYLMKRRTRVANLFRSELASPRPMDRIRSARIVGLFGTLNDISLLQDLLALPEMHDQREEREAYLAAINDLANEGERINE